MSGSARDPAVLAFKLARGWKDDEDARHFREQVEMRKATEASLVTARKEAAKVGSWLTACTCLALLLCSTLYTRTSNHNISQEAREEECALRSVAKVLQVLPLTPL